MGDRIAVMNKGRLVQIGTPRELLQSPADEYVRRLMETPTRQAKVVDALLAEIPA
jgi:osmoprotectant transport system ATP-binding protein